MVFDSRIRPIFWPHFDNGAAMSGRGLDYLAAMLRDRLTLHHVALVGYVYGRLRRFKIRERFLLGHRLRCRVWDLTFLTCGFRGRHDGVILTHTGCVSRRYSTPKIAFLVIVLNPSSERFPERPALLASVTV